MRSMAELPALAKILVRLASMTQAFAFRRLGSLQAEAAEAYDGMTFPHYRTVLRLAGADPSVIAIGAMDGAERVGLVLGRIEADGRTASALSVYVVPNYRGNGIATALLTRLEQQLEARGCT